MHRQQPCRRVRLFLLTFFPLSRVRYSRDNPRIQANGMGPVSPTRLSAWAARRAKSDRPVSNPATCHRRTEKRRPAPAEPAAASHPTGLSGASTNSCLTCTTCVVRGTATPGGRANRFTRRRFPSRSLLLREPGCAHHTGPAFPSAKPNYANNTYKTNLLGKKRAPYVSTIFIISPTKSANRRRFSSVNWLNIS